MSSGTSAIDVMLAGLIDYAGLYPPASLNMRAATENYCRYRSGPHGNAVGRFIVDHGRIDELLAAAGSHLNLKLSVILARAPLAHELPKLLDQGFLIESVECKASSPHDVEQLARTLPNLIQVFIEIPFEPMSPEMLRAISNAGACVKLRMGGVVAEAFPAPAAVARTLAAISEAHLSFKATAGLHHPLGSHRSFTSAHDSRTGWMHGFVNLLCAAALIHSGAGVGEAERVLEEQDPRAWTLSPDALGWRTHSWSLNDLSKARKNFISFGSCSFEEPVRDLEALGWL